MEKTTSIEFSISCEEIKKLIASEYSGSTGRDFDLLDANKSSISDEACFYIHQTDSQNVRPDDADGSCG